MRVALALVVASTSACDAELLRSLLGNDVPDAGPEPDPLPIGEIRDAGFTDAGNPECVPPVDPPIEWTCEPDVDHCDDVGDAVAAYPETDIVATWSFVDGDDFVLQVRFSAMPFQSRINHDLLFGFVDTAIDTGCIVGDQEEEHGELQVGVCMVFGQPSEALFPKEYFPPDEWEPAPQSAEWVEAMEPYRCAPRLHPTQPLLEMRFPLSFVESSAGSIRYGVESACEWCPFIDVSWRDHEDIAAVTSSGGRADETDELVGICDIPCPSG